MSVDLSNFDQEMLQRALTEAKRAVKTGDVPIAAVICQNNQFLCSAYNQKEARSDLTAHAEVLAIKEAQRLLGDWRLNNCTLYVTLEPCAMCAGTILQARLSRVVYALKDQKTGACGSFLDILTHQKIKKTTVDYIHMPESASILNSFFQSLRS